MTSVELIDINLYFFATIATAFIDLGRVVLLPPIFKDGQITIPLTDFRVGVSLDILKLSNATPFR